MKVFRSFALGFAVLIAVAVAVVPFMPTTLAATADPTYGCNVYIAQGCSELHIASGGTFIMDSGSTLTLSQMTASRLAVTNGSGVLASNGSITTNAVPKSASSGATLVASAISDDGTNVSITEPAIQTGANGAQVSCGWSAMENLTLSTGGTTTDTTGNLLPANSIIKAVVARVTTTITAACTGWSVGDSVTAARFITNDTTLTANEVQVGLNAMAGVVSTTAAGPTQAAAAKVRVTCAGGNPGAGAIRLQVYACTFTAPTS